MSRLGGVVRSLLGGVIAGTGAWATAQFTSDMVIRGEAIDQGLPRAEGKEELVKVLGGGPLRTGPWYQDVVATQGSIAHVTFVVEGQKAKCDICVGLKRPPQWPHNALFQLLSREPWELAYCEAAVIRAGTRKTRMPLLSPEECRTCPPAPPAGGESARPPPPPEVQS